MADLGEEAFSSQMKVVATFLRLLEELMRNKQQDLRYGTKTQRRGILGRMKDFVGGIFKKVYDGTFGRLSRNGKDYGQLDLNDPAVAKLFADTMKQMGMDAMHEDNNLLFSTSDVAKIMAFSKMVEQELGKKIEHENDTPEKEQSQEHGQDQERQANARGWSDYPATPEQIDLTATVLAADEGVSIDEIKKDFSENPSIGELQIALEAKGHDTMAIQPDLKNYATPEQRAQLDMLKDKGIIGENELMQLGKYPSQDKASEVLENHADAVKMLDSDEISNRAEAIRSHDGMDPDSHTKQVESWKEDLSAKVGNAFEASRDAKGQPNLNNFALQCNLRGIAVQFANDGELLFTDANQHHKQVRADNLDPKFSRNSEAFKGHFGLQVAYIRSYIMKHTWAHCAKDDNSHLKANFTAKKIFQKTNGFAQWAIIRQSLTMSYCVENLKQGRKPELTIFTSKKRTFPQAFSVRKSVVQAVEKFLQKEKLYVKRDTNVPFSARPEKKALRTAKVHSYPRSILKAQFSMS